MRRWREQGLSRCVLSVGGVGTWLIAVERTGSLRIALTDSSASRPLRKKMISLSEIKIPAPSNAGSTAGELGSRARSSRARSRPLDLNRATKTTRSMA
jgi:hypothetical protein